MYTHEAPQAFLHHSPSAASNALSERIFPQAPVVTMRVDDDELTADLLDLLEPSEQDPVPNPFDLVPDESEPVRELEPASAPEPAAQPPGLGRVVPSDCSQLGDDADKMTVCARFEKFENDKTIRSMREVWSAHLP